jgi:DNA-binding IclR family transcriptional regulator
MNVQPLATAIKCLRLLDLISESSEPVRISDLGRKFGESRSTTYQRLLTLTTAGWLERMPDGSYRLSTRAVRIGAAALQQAGFGERAQPILDQLQEELREAVSLVMLEQEKIVIVRRTESQDVLRADLQIGTELSYNDSSSGAIWLAFGPEPLIEQVRASGRPLPSQARIAKAQKDRASIGGGGETLPGIASMAVPVFDQFGGCLASLSISSPEIRFKPDDFLPAMRRAALALAEISGK